MRRMIVMLLLAYGAAPGDAALAATDDATFDSVVARISATETLRGRYSQIREIEALSRPLESGGRFIVSELGLYWEQAEPFASVLIADGERLSQSIAGQPMVTITAAEQPVLLSISQVLIGIFKGQGALLAQHFDIAFEAQGDEWKMALTPKELPLSEAVEGIEIEGRDFMERLRVRGRAADELTVTFFDLRNQPVDLSREERGLYTR